MQKLLRFLAWEIVNPGLLKIKRKRRYAVPTGFHGINIGCGIDNPPNWIGIDGGMSVLLAHYPAWFIKGLFRIFSNSNVGARKDFIEKIKNTRIVHHDFSFGLPMNDATVPAVYSSHFFEHLQKPQAEALLKECFRVMKPGAIIRICVPNLSEEIVKIKNALAAYENGDVQPIERFVTFNPKGSVNSYSFHRWMYDFREMRSLLESLGFSDIQECTFRSGRIQDVSILDTRGGLHVEAIKPN